MTRASARRYQATLQAALKTHQAALERNPDSPAARVMVAQTEKELAKLEAELAPRVSATRADGGGSNAQQ